MIVFLGLRRHVYIAQSGLRVAVVRCLERIFSLCNRMEQTSTFHRIFREMKFGTRDRALEYFSEDLYSREGQHFRHCKAGPNRVMRYSPSLMIPKCQWVRMT
jgi:hypothetical protein